MREVDYKNYNSIALAFMGDAVYERFIRERILRSGKTGADKMHRAAVRYVKAAAQELSLREMLDDLTEDEQVVVHRARNHKITSKPKNADPLNGADGAGGADRRKQLTLTQRERPGIPL